MESTTFLTGFPINVRTYIVYTYVRQSTIHTSCNYSLQQLQMVYMLINQIKLRTEIESKRKKSVQMLKKRRTRYLAALKLPNQLSTHSTSSSRQFSTIKNSNYSLTCHKIHPVLRIKKKILLHISSLCLHD